MGMLDARIVVNPPQIKDIRFCVCLGLMRLHDNVFRASTEGGTTGTKAMFFHNRYLL